jgi:molybdopterin synthase catalytic subunit
MQEIRITSEKIQVQTCIDFVRDNGAGAISTFVGSVRNISNDKKVVRLEYESRESMAVKEMEKIAEVALVRYHLIKICIIHRVGRLEIGEDSVVIAVSGRHRKDTIAGCSYIIETLKKTVPIWKKEIFEDGEEWVSNTP